MASGSASPLHGVPSGRRVEDFSLLGLLDVIRLNDADLATFALGVDFSTLNLDLTSNEYASF